MNCPSCGAPMHPDGDGLKCDYCLSFYFPEKDDSGVRVLGEPSDHACPICKLPLVDAVIATIHILYCTQCRSMLVPMQVFQALIEKLQAAQGGAAIQPAVGNKDLSRRIDCPHCHQPMDAHFYAGPGNVVIDSCDQCMLIWLDHGELMRIVRAPDDRNPAALFDAAPDQYDDSGG
jgi:Zn-finger nucleic acid-binding protein